MNFIVVVLLVLVLAAAAVVKGARQLNHKLYKKNVASYPCIRLLNQKLGPVGCNSGKNGDIAVLRLFNQQNDIDEYVHNDIIGGPKISAVLNQSLLTTDNFNKLLNTRKIGNVLLFGKNRPAGGFSPDSQTPLSEYGLNSDNSHVWNPNGNNLSYRNFDFPMFVIDEDGVEDVVEKALKNKDRNYNYPRYSSQLQTFMWATDNSKVCLRRGFCDPLGASSIYGSFSLLNNNDQTTTTRRTTKEIVVVSATLDSTALFHDLAVGASAYTSGLVVALGIAATLVENLGVSALSSLEKDILFTFFNGEAYGYLGSTRFVSDVKNFKCLEVDKKDSNICNHPYRPSLNFKNIPFDSITSVIDVSQVGLLPSSSSNFYIHTPSNPNTPTLNLVNLAETVTATLPAPLVLFSSDYGLPPSAAIQFIKESNSPSDLATILVADHQATFENLNYHSHFDLYEDVNVDALCDLTTSLSQLVLTFANSSSPSAPSPLPNLQANCSLVKTLAYCLMSNISCPLVAPYFESVSGDVVSKYVSIFFSGNNPVTQFAHLYLSELLSHLPQSSPTECKKLSDCDGVAGTNCIRQQCVKSFGDYHDAYPMAVQYGKNAWIDNKDSDTTNYWTESVWEVDIGFRVFEEDDPSNELLYLFFGIFIFILSFVLVYVTQKYVSVHLKSN